MLKKIKIVYNSKIKQKQKLSLKYVNKNVIQLNKI